MAKAIIAAALAIGIAEGASGGACSDFLQQMAHNEQPVSYDTCNSFCHACGGGDCSSQTSLSSAEQLACTAGHHGCFVDYQGELPASCTAPHTQALPKSMVSPACDFAGDWRTELGGDYSLEEYGAHGYKRNDGLVYSLSDDKLQDPRGQVGTMQSNCNVIDWSNGGTWMRLGDEADSAAEGTSGGACSDFLQQMAHNEQPVSYDTCNSFCHACGGGDCSSQTSLSDAEQLACTAGHHGCFVYYQGELPASCTAPHTIAVEIAKETSGETCSDFIQQMAHHEEEVSYETCNSFCNSCGGGDCSSQTSLSPAEQLACNVGHHGCFVYYQGDLPASCTAPHIDAAVAV